MSQTNDYTAINKSTWNDKVDVHMASDFYDMDGFLNGKSTLNEIELELLGDVSGKKILHLQCHFGQDTLSLAKMGAEVTGVDFSEKAIAKARALTQTLNLKAQFVCCDVYDTPKYIH
jgi:2-polyprenyl-3-methyl-5-hydroxy-6-metoxy-1,4-benzoquinol methylase